MAANVFTVGEQFAGKSLEQLSKEGVDLGRADVLANLLGVDQKQKLQAGQTFSFKQADELSGGAEFQGAVRAFGNPITQEQAAVAPAIQTLEKQKDPIKKAYSDLIASIKGREELAVKQGNINTAREFAKRGIPTSSGVVADTQAGRARDIGVQFGGLEAGATLDQQKTELGLANTISQLQATAGLTGVENQLRREQLVQQANQFAQDLGIRKAQLDQMIKSDEFSMDIAKQKLPFELQALQKSASGGGSSKRSTSIIDVGGRAKLIDTQTGSIIRDLGASEVTKPLTAAEELEEFFAKQALEEAKAGGSSGGGAIESIRNFLFGS